MHARRTSAFQTPPPYRIGMYTRDLTTTHMTILPKGPQLAVLAGYISVDHGSVFTYDFLFDKGIPIEVWNAQ
jgi:hypothetical protein